MKSTVQYPGPITLDTLDDLLAHHRATFGGWSMREDDDDSGEDDVEVDDADADDDDGDDDGDGEDYTPPTKEEWQRTQEALKKANAEAKKRRLALREARDADDSGDGDGDAEKKAEAKWKPRVANAAARAALLDAGATKPERLLKLLDLDELDVTDDGEVDGLDSEVDRLREEYPELFPTTRRRSGGRVETGDRSGGRGPGAKTKSATDRQVEQLTRGR